MKRPAALYFVAAWCCFGLLAQVGPLLEFLGESRLTTDFWKAAFSSLSLAALAVVIWHTFGLINMRRLHRWFAIAFFATWSVAQIWLCSAAVYRGTVRVLPALLILSILSTPSLLGIWYLSRRRFRELAVQFAAENEKASYARAMQKASERKLREGTRS